MLVHTAVPMKPDEVETYNAGAIVEEVVFEFKDELNESILSPKTLEVQEKKILNKSFAKSSKQRILNVESFKVIPKSAWNAKKARKANELVVSSNEINSSHEDPVVCEVVDDIL